MVVIVRNFEHIIVDGEPAHAHHRFRETVDSGDAINALFCHAHSVTFA